METRVQTRKGGKDQLINSCDIAPLTNYSFTSDLIVDGDCASLLFDPTLNDYDFIIDNGAEILGDSTIIFNDRTTDPSAPPLGKVKLFIKNGEPYIINSAGTVSGFKTVFGSSTRSAKRTTSATNTSNTTSGFLFLDLDINPVPAGEYILMGSAKYKMSTVGRNAKIRLSANNTVVGQSYEEVETKDSGSDIRIQYNDFGKVTLAGNEVVEIEYAPENNGDTMTMYSAELFLFRVA